MPAAWAETGRSLRKDAASPNGLPGHDTDRMLSFTRAVLAVSYSGTIGRYIGRQAVKGHGAVYGVISGQVFFHVWAKHVWLEKCVAA